MIDGVTIPRSEYEGLKAAQAQIAVMQAQIDELSRALFGRKSERVVEDGDKTPDLPELAAFLEGLEGTAEPKKEETTVPEHKRKKPKNKGKFTLELSDDLPQEVVVIDVPEEERTLADGTALVKIGEDREVKLAHRPAEYFLKVIVRPKYAHRDDPSFGVVQEPVPSSVFKGGKVDPSFVAHLITEKYAFHQPLYRLQERLRSRGVGITRQYLSSLILSGGTALQPLFELLLERLLSTPCIHADETGVKMLDPGAGQCKNCKAWVYVAGGANAPPYVVFDFTDSRKQKFLFDVLADYSGTVQADAYVAYENLDKMRDDVDWAACWAHARRKFEACLDGPSAELARWVIRQVRYLFLFERVAWKRDETERLRIRQEHEKPLVDELFQRLLHELANNPVVTPKSAFAKAAAYLLKRPVPFKRYLDDPHARIDNNPAERALRKIAVGRKNWLFVGSHKAGKNMAILLSFVQTCRAMEICPSEYFQDVFRRLPKHPKDRLLELLPDQWKAAKLATL